MTIPEFIALLSQAYNSTRDFASIVAQISDQNGFRKSSIRDTEGVAVFWGDLLHQVDQVRHLDAATIFGELSNACIKYQSEFQQLQKIASSSGQRSDTLCEFLALVSSNAGVDGSIPPTQTNKAPSGLPSYSKSGTGVSIDERKARIAYLLDAVPTELAEGDAGDPKSEPGRTCLTLWWMSEWKKSQEFVRQHTAFLQNFLKLRMAITNYLNCTIVLEKFELQEQILETIAELGQLRPIWLTSNPRPNNWKTCLSSYVQMRQPGFTLKPLVDDLESLVAWAGSFERRASHTLISPIKRPAVKLALIPPLDRRLAMQCQHNISCLIQRIPDLLHESADCTAIAITNAFSHFSISDLGRRIEKVSENLPHNNLDQYPAHRVWPKRKHQP